MTYSDLKLRIVYISALSCIAILSITAAWFLSSYEEAISADAPVINVAARQRTLSQRIANLSQQLYMSTVRVDTSDVAVLSEQLNQALLDWETAHDGLRVRGGTYGLRGRNSPDLVAALADAQRTLDDAAVSTRHLLEEARDIVNFSPTDAAAAAADVNRATEIFLLQMEEIVTQMTQAAVSNVERLRTLEKSVSFVTLVLLVVLAVFAFEPALKTLKRQASDLIALRNALDAHTSFSVTDRRGRIIDVNDAFCRISGYTRDELVGATHAILNSGQHSRSFWTHMWQTLTAGRTWREEICNRAKDGSFYWVDATNIPQLDKDGKIERFISLRFDVTEKRRAEAARKQALNQLESVLNAASQFAIISCGLDGCIETFNSGAEKMLGYSKDEALGRNMADLFLLKSEVLDLAQKLSKQLGRSVSPDDAPSWHAQRGGHDHHQWTYVCSDGRQLTVTTTVTGIFDAEGQLTGYVGITQDITDKLKTERQLEQQRAEQRAIIDAIPSSVWYKTRDQRILDCNRAAADSLGMDREQIRGKRTTDLLPPEFASRQLLADAQVLDSGVSALGHIEEYRLPGAAPRYLRMDKTPLQNQDGEFDRIVVISTDISEMVRANEQLREAEERLDMALEASNTGLWDWNIVTGEAYFSNVVLRMLGYDHGELKMTIGTWKELCHPDDLARATAALDAHIAGKTEAYSCEYRIRHKDGTFRWVRDVGKVVERDESQAAIRIVGVYVDIQALRDALDDVERSNDRLLESQQRFEHAVEGSRDAIFDWNIETGEVWYSQRWLELLKIKEAELGSSIEHLLFHATPEDAARVERELDELIASVEDRYESEFQLVDSAQNVVWVMIRAFVTRDVAGEALRVAGSAADITALKEAEAEMRRLVQQDQLTGLASRTRLTERLEHAVARARRNGNYCGVLFFDFDRFKVVNDSLGHDVGDELLCSIAERLRSNLREVDTPARFGGDEFVVLLEDLHDPAAAVLVAEKLLGICADPHQIRGHSLLSTASIGVVTSEHAQAGGLELLGYADSAMYQAKRQGRACVVEFDQAMFAAEQKSAELEEELPIALESGQLQLYYQPIVDLDSGAIVSAEALLRWHHPTKGSIPPDEFIQIAEESKLIVPIGEWVVAEACRQLVDWRKRGVVSSHFAISVNVSKVQLLTPNFTAQLVESIDKCGLPREALKLEVTETTIVDNRSDIGRVLQSLRDESIVIMMDDFGTGHSSLSVLHNLPIDELKIDQSFIRHADTNRELVAITSSIVTLAEHLSLKTIGEGIELPEHIALLQTLGCTYGQGYFWSKPMPAIEIEERLGQFGSMRSASA